MAALASVAPNQALDVKRFEILKGIHYYQISSGSARLQTNNAYRFTTQVYADVIGDVLSSSILTSKSQTLQLLADTDGDPFRFRDKFDEQFGLVNNFPNGVFTLSIHTAHDGDRSMAFSLTGDAYPAAPVLNNYGDAQGFPYNEYTVISWQPFAGGAVTDYIQLQIEDLNGKNIWQTPDFGERGALSGLETQTIVPPETLTPGVIYIGTIRFVKVLYSTSRVYPTVGTVGYYARTEFTLRPVDIGVTRLVDRIQLWNVRAGGPDLDGQISDLKVRFDSKVDTVTSNQLAGVSLTLPNGQSPGFTTNALNDSFSLSQEANYPPGSYTFGLEQLNGITNRVTIDYPAGAFPSFPWLMNLATFNDHPATEDLVVSWRPWTNAAPLDFIRLELFDSGSKVWDTPTFSSAKHLRSSDTAVTIPGTNFLAGHNYSIRAHFFHVTISDTRIVPGGIVFGGFDSSAEFSFTTRPTDVSGMELAIGRTVWETMDGIYQPDVDAPFHFEAEADAATTDSIRSAQVTSPNGATLPLAPNSDATKFTVFRPEATLELLQNHYPTGVYQFHFETLHDGSRNVGVNLFTNQLPPLPHLRFFRAARSFAAGGNQALLCDPWSGANPETDSITLTITNTGGKSFSVRVPPVLTNSVQSITIPADSLSKSKFYIARLRFERRIQSGDTNYTGVFGAASVYSELAYTLATVVGFGAAAPALLPSGEYRFTITNTPVNRTYVFSFSPDLTNWTTITTNVNTSSFSIIRPAGEREFFRADVVSF
jgi:hypothetical protein